MPAPRLKGSRPWHFRAEKGGQGWNFFTALGSTKRNDIQLLVTEVGVASPLVPAGCGVWLSHRRVSGNRKLKKGSERESAVIMYSTVKSLLSAFDFATCKDMSILCG